MGVRRKDYIILGVDVGYETFKNLDQLLEDEAFQEMESYIHNNKSGEMTIIPQWEDEKGCYVGYLIAKSDEYYGFENVHKISLNYHDDDEIDDVLQFVYDHFDKIIDPEDVKVFVFTQWL